MSLVEESNSSTRITFEIRSGVGREGYVVAPSGQLDAGTCDRLAEAMDNALLSDAEWVMLDLSGLELIDPSGLQAIIVADLMAAGHGKDLKIRRGREAL